MTRDLTVETVSNSCPVNESNTQLPTPYRIKLTTLRKASHDAQCSCHLVTDFTCLILIISIYPHADAPQLQTVILQSSAQQLWEMPQNSHHDNEI